MPEVESGVTHLLGTPRVLDRTTRHAEGFAGLSPAHLSVTFAPDAARVLEALELEEHFDHRAGCQMTLMSGDDGTCGREPVTWSVTCPACLLQRVVCTPCHDSILETFPPRPGYWIRHDPCGQPVLTTEIRWVPI